MSRWPTSRPCSGSDRAGRLIPDLLVDFLQQPAAGLDASDIGGDLGDELRARSAGARHAASRSLSDAAIAGFPAATARGTARRARHRRAVPESSAAIRSASTTCLPRPILMTIAPSRHHREGAGAQDTLGLAGQRQQADRDVGLVHEPFELIRAVEDRDFFVLARRAHPGRHRKAERFQYQRRRLRHQPEAEKPDAALLRAARSAGAAIRGWPAPADRAASRGETAARA